MSDTLKGFTINVLRPANGSDCTNGGISSRVTRITVLATGKGSDLPAMYAPTEDAPGFIIDERMGYKFLRPAAAVPRRMNGYMFGGNYAVTCDSRWKFGALPIHDRTETPEQTAFLSV